jgi:DNA segregation ATPase FtsK/SpoIIIE-like protein
MSKKKKEIYGILADLLSRSASVGIHFLLSSQKTTGEVIPTFITENAGYRIGLRTSNEQGSYNVIGDKGCEDIPVDAKGRGICFADEKINFQSFYVDDETINKICKKHKRENDENEKINE